MLITLILYNSVLILSTAFVYLSEKTPFPTERIIMRLLAFSIVFLPAALRYEIGIDYFSYKLIFENIRDGNYLISDGKVEPGYYALNWVVANLGLPFECLIAIVSFFILFLFNLSYPKKNKYIFHFAFIALLYFTTFNLLRSWLALSIAWLGISLLYNNKIGWTKYIFIILFSVLFHKSSVVFLILPFFSVRFYFSAPLISSLSIATLFFALLFYSENLVDFIFNNPISKFLGYSSYSTSWYARKTDIGTGLGVIFNGLFLTYILFHHNKIKLLNENKHLLVSLIIITIIVQAAAANIHIFGRLNHIFYFSYFLALGFYLNHKIFLSKFIILFFLFLAFFDFNRSILNGSTDYMVTCSGARIAPYISIFNKDDSKREPYLTSRRNWCEDFFESN